MLRESAKYIAKRLIDFSPSDVYELWCDMGLVVKDKFGDWVITELGRSAGGQMSKHPYHSVPIFEPEKIIDMMIEWYQANKM